MTETEIVFTRDYDIDNGPTIHKEIKLSGEEFILSSEDSLDREESEIHYEDKRKHHKDDELTENESRTDDESGNNKENRHQKVDKDDDSAFDNQFAYGEGPVQKIQDDKQED